jgi:outer membrane protein OmpA-like peptidoglycan-associated protein
MTTSTLPRRAAATLAAVACLLTATGCAQVQSLFSPPAPPAAEQVPLSCPGQAGGPVTLVVGARANSPRPDLPSEIQGLIREAAKKSAKVQVVQVDGAPRVTIGATFDEAAQSTEAQRRALEKFTTNFSTLLSQLTPKQAEADVFEAVRTAALATPSGGTIVLIDSGIPTKGQLSFLEGDLFGAALKPDDITGYLTTKRLLPDMEGRSVVLVNLGRTAEPQPELNEDLRTRVVSMWEHVFSAAHAACTQSLVGAPPRTSVDTKGVGVTTVPLPADPIYEPCSATVLSDGGPVGFEGDLAEFRNEDAARTALQPLADDAMRGDMSVRLVGTTASGRDKKFRDQLSEDRAEAVKKILVEQGVDAGRITTFGAGNESKYHVDDEAPGGGLLPGPAAGNRRVVVELSCSAP